MQPMLIAPFKTGVDTDMEPWLLPPDAFQEADNVHVHHGFLQKRAGYRLFGTLSNGERVMGIARYIQADGTKETLAFDTSNAYLYNSISHAFAILDTGAPVFSSGAYDYIWVANWQSSNVVNRLYFTNGLAWNGSAGAAARNGIRFFSSASTTTTTLFTPSTGGGNTLYGCKLLFTLGQRLVALNTFENAGASTENFPQRARWCAKQSPANWDDVTAGGGDFADAGTGDQIVSAQALQNQIIVFFTNSVWALIPTSDPNKAFRWVRLNSYRACDGKMASVAYDRYVIALGIRGITATDGTETQRVDNRILDFTNSAINLAEFGKVFCLRSYETERWWTLYSGVEAEENDKSLIYDDESKAFTNYSINLNCLGYGNADRDYTLQDFSVVNDLYYSLDEMGDDTLLDWYFDQNQDILLGGDITGNIYELEFGAEDEETSIDATFTTAAWNPYQSEAREAQMSYVDFYVDTDKETTATVDFYKNDQVSPYISQQITFLPNLNFVSLITSITNASPAVVFSPNHGLVTGQTVYIYGSLGMKEINSGNGNIITVLTDNSFSLDGIDSTAYGTYTGGGKVYLREFYQTKTWVRAYGGGIGYLHWVKLTLRGGERPFRFHAIKPSFRPRGRRTIN